MRSGLYMSSIHDRQYAYSETTFRPPRADQTERRGVGLGIRPMERDILEASAQSCDNPGPRSPPRRSQRVTWMPEESHNSYKKITKKYNLMLGICSAKFVHSLFLW